MYLIQLPDPIWPWERQSRLTLFRFCPQRQDIVPEALLGKFIRCHAFAHKDSLQNRLAPMTTQMCNCKGWQIFDLKQWSSSSKHALCRTEVPSGIGRWSNKVLAQWRRFRDV